MNLSKLFSVAKISGIFVAIGLVALFTSCENKTLSPRAAKKALEKETAFRDSSQVIAFNVGYYEVDSAARKKLEALSKVGVINCKISEITEHHCFERYTWWEGTKVFFKDVKHYFAEVSLSEEGKKYIVANPPVKPLGEDDIPGYDDHNMSDTLYIASDTGETAADSAEVVPAQSEETATEGNDDYSKALKKVKFSTVNVLVGFYKIEKVFDVCCPESYKRAGIGKCNFVCVFKGITPFGAEFTSHKEGERTLGNADFVRYEDKGWRVDIYNTNSGGSPSLPMLVTD